MNIKDYQVVLLGVMIALGSVVSTYIFSKSIIAFQKLQNQTIKVTGSASRTVKSDYSSWNFSFSTQQPNLKLGYAKIIDDSKIIKEFLISKGLDESNIDFSQISSYKLYKRAPNGYSDTDELKGYNVSRSVTVKSSDITKLTNISKDAAALVNKGIDLTSDNVNYYISNLDNLKIETIKDAAKNAKERANSLVKGTNGKIGVMTSAKVGVFQIVPIDSTAVEDYGINDTSSIDKKVIATVNATFTVK